MRILKNKIQIFQTFAQRQPLIGLFWKWKNDSSFIFAKPSGAPFYRLLLREYYESGPVLDTRNFLKNGLRNNESEGSVWLTHTCRHVQLFF